MNDDKWSLLAMNDGLYADHDGGEDDIQIGKKNLIKRYD